MIIREVKKKTKKTVKAWIDLASDGKPYRSGLLADFASGQLIIYHQKTDKVGLTPCTVTYEI